MPLTTLSLNFVEEDLDHSVAKEGFKQHDVLCARDKDSYNHIGNRRFRALIQHHFPAYDNASRQEKTKIVSRLHFSCTAEMGVQFWKKSGSEWLELTTKDVRNKIAHAFRDTKIAIHGKSKKRKETRAQNAIARLTKRSSAMSIYPSKVPSFSEAVDFFSLTNALKQGLNAPVKRSSLVLFDDSDLSFLLTTANDPEKSILAEPDWTPLDIEAQTDLDTLDLIQDLFSN